MIQMNSLSLVLVKEKLDDIEPKTVTNNGNLPGLNVGVTANMGKIQSNMFSLLPI